MGSYGLGPDDQSDLDQTASVQAKKPFNWRKLASVALAPDANGNPAGSDPVAAYSGLGKTAGTLASRLFSRNNGSGGLGPDDQSSLPAFANGGIIGRGPMPALVGEAGKEEVIHNGMPEMVRKPEILELGTGPRPDAVIPLTPGPHHLSPAGRKFLHVHGMQQSGGHPFGRHGGFQGMPRMPHLAYGGVVEPEEDEMPPLENPDGEHEPSMPPPPPPGGMPSFAIPSAVDMSKVAAPPKAAPPKKSAREQLAALQAPVAEKPSLLRRLAAGAIGGLGGYNNANPYMRPVDVSSAEQAIKYPGYQHQQAAYNAQKDQLTRQTELERQSKQDELIDFQKRASADALKTNAQNRGLAAQAAKQNADTKVQNEVDRIGKEGGVEVPVQNGVLPPMTPEDEKNYHYQSSVVANKTFKVPNRDHEVTTELASTNIGQAMGLQPGDKIDSKMYAGLANLTAKEEKKPNLKFEHFTDENTGDVTTVGFDPATGKSVSTEVTKGIAKKRPQINHTSVNIGAGLETDAIDSAARRYNKTGELPPMGMGSAGASVRTTILNRAAQMDKGADIASNKQDYQAQTGSLKSLQKMSDNVQAFENTASMNADLALKASNATDRTGVPLLNRAYQAVQTNVWGDPELRQFKVYVKTFANEYAKVMTSNGASGSVTDAARKGADDLLGTTNNPKEFKAAIEAMKNDMANRRSGLNSQLKEIKGRGNSGGGAGAPHPDPMGIR